MKKYLGILLFASVCTAMHGQESFKEPYLVKQLDGESIGQVRAETSGGNISVEGVESKARIEVYVRPGNSRDRNISKDELKKWLEEDYDLSITADNHNLTAIAKPKHNSSSGRRNLGISFKIFVPHNVSTHLTTSGGNINLHSLAGTQDFTTSGGNLDLDHLSGHIKGRTSGGNVSLSELQDEIDLSTSGGNIDAKKTHGTITLTTSGGELHLSELQGNIKATTSGGNVEANEIEGELASHTSGGNINMTNLSCSVETSTSGGNIAVSVKTLGKFVKISNSGGNTDLQIPAGKGVDLTLSADKVDASGLSGFKGDVKKDRVAGTLNGGGIPVTVHGGSMINFTQK